MSQNENQIRDLYGRYIDAINHRRLDELDQFTHDSVNFNGQQMTRAEYRAAMEVHLDSVPDFTWWVDEFVIDDNNVFVRLIDHGTPTKEWLGLQPNGAQIHFLEFVMYRFRDGRFDWINVVLDRPSIARQLEGETASLFLAR